jgi:hypothetical protein
VADEAAIFFTSSPVSQLGLATAFATEPATGAGLAVSAAAMYSFGGAIRPRLRDVWPLLLGRDRRPSAGFMRAKIAEDMTNTRPKAITTPTARRPADPLVAQAIDDASWPSSSSSGSSSMVAR